MPTAAKIKQVKQIKKRYDAASGVIFTDYRGLSVPAMQRLRRSLQEQGAEISVVKNTLFRLATTDDHGKYPDDMVIGPTAVTYIKDDEAAAAKALFDFIKENKAFVVKGGYLDGRFYDSAEMEALSKLPPKDVLIAQVIATIIAPMSNVVSTIEAIYAGPIRAIGAVADKMAEEAPAVEAKVEEPATEAPAEEPKAEDVPPAVEAKSDEPAADASTEEPKAEEAPAATEAKADEPAEEPKAEEAPAEPAPTDSAEADPPAEAPTEEKQE